MAIKFICAYVTMGIPPEVFALAQVVEDRDEASERHFVSRGVAAYLAADGTLTDIDGKVVPDAEPVEVIAGLRDVANPSPDDSGEGKGASAGTTPDAGGEQTPAGEAPPVGTATAAEKPADGPGEGKGDDHATKVADAVVTTADVKPAKATRSK